MRNDNEWIAWALILGFFPVYGSLAALTSWLWFRDGNRVQAWIDTWIAHRTTAKVERYLERHPNNPRKP